MDGLVTRALRHPFRARNHSKAAKSKEFPFAVGGAWRSLVASFHGVEVEDPAERSEGNGAKPDREGRTFESCHPDQLLPLNLYKSC